MGGLAESRKVCSVVRGKTAGNGVQEEEQRCRHFGHLQVPMILEEADLLTGCHISGAQLRASWSMGRSTAYGVLVTACGQAGMGELRGLTVYLLRSVSLLPFSRHIHIHCVLLGNSNHHLRQKTGLLLSCLQLWSGAYIRGTGLQSRPSSVPSLPGFSILSGKNALS